ncbi:MULTISPECIES: DUF4335 domain-containing protein [unclassified Coleofasciculus]|uniref:DUF4335 domain-containing protein n=1 Tax=unclassified Coleofasciculus TaxID=2692782 RepID=UPI001881457D|nr:MULTISPECIES: DUF4335 domain-containing protein [unclassified Coleofasciculus]MBE9125616.1 DUF4335 domain-containing protein [Coleofasciculus sp. LEGE 07081]MBE9147330.1 DUF4335 domain-containing protein [Coleofasciculus sp. LEGE 07092]
MTIRRQYSLPNCTLILEGLSEATGAVGSQIDTRPLMTILVNAECHLAGQKQPLSGGRDFLEGLVQVVSRYAQEFLSQVHHPKPAGDKPSVVQLHPMPDKNLHRLTLLPTAEGLLPMGASGEMVADGYRAGVEPGKPLQIDLTTVQLFDLVEAIDQLLADQRTLPDLNLRLQPVSRRYRKADQPVTKRAAPAALGTTSLVLAAIAFFLVPIPEVRQPQPNSRETNSQTSEGESPTTRTTPPSASELEKTLASAQEITDPTELDYLKRNLYRKLSQGWENRGQVNQNLEYQVGVARDGTVVGYKSVDDTPMEESQRTPLPDLLYIPAEGGTASREPLAQFRVVFTRGGVLQISPWQGYTAQPGLGPEITDSATIRELNAQIYDELSDRWEGTPLSPRPLVYRVGVTEDGVIADYAPQNQPAWDYVEETPLEKLLKPEAAGIGSEESGFVPTKPLAHFQVVFKPDGVLEVSPFRGR